ncbi:LA_2272 family surface repeat-containing protein [Flavobacterium chungnamense]
MKKRFLIFLFLVSLSVFSQNDSISSTVFSLTPRSNKDIRVNGIAIGLGINMGDENTLSKINGLNIEINPLSIFILMFDDPSRRGFSESSTATINGISLSSGHSNQNEDIVYNGLQFSLFSTSHSCNGISLNGFYNYATNMNGVHGSFLLNYSKKSNGLFVSFSNYSEINNGLQIGVFNKTENFYGVQLGVINKTKKQKGLQIGLWNINSKRSMPFLNW